MYEGLRRILGEKDFSKGTLVKIISRKELIEKYIEPLEGEDVIIVCKYEDTVVQGDPGTFLNSKFRRGFLYFDKIKDELDEDKYHFDKIKDQIFLDKKHWDHGLTNLNGIYDIIPIGSF